MVVMEHLLLCYLVTLSPSAIFRTPWGLEQSSLHFCFCALAESRCTYEIPEDKELCGAASSTRNCIARSHPFACHGAS